MKESCFNVCVSQNKFQAFYLDATKKGIITHNVKDQCCPSFAVGKSFSEHLRGRNITMMDCNNSRCRVKERRCCASFGLAAQLLYRFALHINNTAQSYFGFNMDQLKNYEISDAVLFRCHPSSSEIGLIETSKMITIKRFSFIQTKMLWIIANDRDSFSMFQSTREGQCLFVDCVTDTLPSKFVIRGRNITFKNLITIQKGKTFDMPMIHGQWSCMTDIPIPLPKQTEAPKRTPFPTVAPTKTLPMMKEIEMIDMENSSGFKLTTEDLIQLSLLGILAAVTVAVFYLVKIKRNALRAVNPDENLSLLQE